MELNRDNRAYPRQPLELQGRLMLPAHSEFDCSTVNISPDGLLIKCQGRPYRGQGVVGYFEKLGRVEGVVTRIDRDGDCFAIMLRVGTRKKQQLAAIVAGLVGGDVAASWQIRTDPSPSALKAENLRALNPDFLDPTFGLNRSVDEDRSLKAEPKPLRPMADPLRKYLDFV